MPESTMVVSTPARLGLSLPLFPLLMLPLLLLLLDPAAAFATPSSPNIIFIVGDDVGYNDLGAVNGNRTYTPHLDRLKADGITLSSYYTFKVCSPSRAAMLTGRYPWGAGFYDMSEDTNHCTRNFTALPQMLDGYKRHALGKWDTGFLLEECTPTERGFDTFLGYYEACEADYWYHGASGGYPHTCPGQRPTDLANSTSKGIRGASLALNGTYNTHVFGGEAVRLIEAHDPLSPMYMYLAFMNVHDGCEGDLGKQAPLGTVHAHYNHTSADTYKLSGAMYTEMDAAVGGVVAALKRQAMWENTVVVFVSDNGGPLDHCTNFPLRGGKHTFFEGGVRVTSFISGPGARIPSNRRGAEWGGLAASADWYHTLVEGFAGGSVPEDTCAPGYACRQSDGFNLWPAILAGAPGPRREVVHQVNNQYICDTTHGASCSAAIRVDDMKLIIGNPGDSRTLRWPSPSEEPVPFGRSGGVVEAGTDHARAPSASLKPIFELECDPYCLFNLTADLGEQHDLAGDPRFTALAAKLSARLAYHGSTGPPPAYIWSDTKVWHDKVFEGPNSLCERSERTGVVQPLDYKEEPHESEDTVPDV